MKGLREFDWQQQIEIFVAGWFKIAHHQQHWLSPWDKTSHGLTPHALPASWASNSVIFE